MNDKITAAYWMAIASQLATAATCRANVGCVLVYQNQIVGHGYVGSVHGDVHCADQDLNHRHHILMKTDQRGSSRTGDTCIRTVHAELNAVLKCTVRGSYEHGWIDCYSTYQPCLECTKALLQIGVRKMYYRHAYQDDWREAFVKHCTLFDALRLGGKDYAQYIQCGV
jgi:dCMP deaminase